MSHNHYLECRACGVSTERESDSRGDGHAGSCYVRFSSLYSDVLVECAPFVSRLVQRGVEFDSEAWVWVHFVAEHAHCNAFWEVCENAEYGSGCDGVPRRILVKDVSEPACSVCHGRRLVPCPECAEEQCRNTT